jgi:hypothetical protein
MNAFLRRDHASHLLLYRALLFIFIALLFSMAGEHLNASETEPTIAELLRRYDQSLSCYGNFKGEWKTECSREWQQDTSGKYFQMPTDGNEKETRFSSIWRNNDRERSVVTVDRGKGRETQVETVCVRNGKWLKLTTIAITGKMQPIARDFAHSLNLATPEMTFGTIFGENISAFVAPLTKSLRSQIEDGSLYYVISGRPSDQTFDIELWFDSTRSNSLAKIKYVSHVDFDASQNNSEQRLSFEWTVDRFQKISDVYVPSNVTLKSYVPTYQIEEPPKNTLISIPPATDTFKSSLVSIEFSPNLSDADLEPTTHVADGTPVHMSDAPHLSFEWEAGKIVPVGTKTMKTLRDSQFLDGPSRQLWVTCNVVFVAVLAVIVIVRWRRARASSGQKRD